MASLADGDGVPDRDGRQSVHLLSRPAPPLMPVQVTRSSLTSTVQFEPEGWV